MGEGIRGTAAEPLEPPIIISNNLREWYAIPASERPVLIDIREEHAFVARRFARSASLPFPQLLDLLFELPEPSVPLALISTTQEEGLDAVRLLKSRSWSNIPFVFLGNEEGMWTRGEELELLASGPVTPRERFIAFTPNPFLVSQIERIEEALLLSRRQGQVQENGECPHPSAPAAVVKFTCCDVGCGAGRDVVWLAKREHWKEMRAVDRLPRALQRVARLAARQGVEEKVVCEAAVIKDDKVSKSFLVGKDGKQRQAQTATQTYTSFERQTYDLVLVIRFLEREFFPSLGNMVNPQGGFLLILSFMAREDGVAYEHPKDPKRLLEKGELARVFGGDGGSGGDGEFIVLEDRVEALPDERFVNAFLAQRKA